MMYNKKREYIQARRNEELEGIGNLMQLYKFNGRDVMGNYSAPPQNIGYAVKLAINSWQV